MTQREFFKRLEKLVQKGWKPYWAVDMWTDEPCRIRLKSPIRIRGKVNFCPVTAVCFDATGKYYGSNAYEFSDKAGKEIELRKARDYATSADYLWFPWESKNKKLLRKKMIKALGLV